MITARIGKESYEFTHKEAERAIEDFLEIKEKISALNEKLASHKEAIVLLAREKLAGSDKATINFETPKGGVKVSFGWDIKIEDEARLQSLLGDKFEFLVKQETLFKPEKRLKEMALEDDGLRECFAIKEKAPSVVEL